MNLHLSSHRGSVQFSRSVVSDSLRPQESQHARPPCPSASPLVAAILDSTGLEHFQHLPGSFSHALFLPISSKHKPSSGFQYHRLVFAVSSLTVTKNIFSVFRWCFIWINDGKVFRNNPFTMHKTVNVTSIIIINYLYYYNYFHLLILLKSIFIRGK